MKRLSLAALAVLPLASFPAFSQPTEPQMRFSATAERSQLDKGLAGWTEYSISLARRGSVRESIEATLTETRRFGVHDTQAGIAVSHPLSPQLTVSAEALASPTHRVLARHALGAVLQYEFAPAWLLHGGARYTRYEDSRVQRGTLALEHYFGDFSAWAGWYPVRALGRSVDGYDARFAWYYADASSVGITLARGDEATQVAPGTVAFAAVRSVALTGRHALGPKFGLTWSLFRTEQGSFYTRQGASAGVQAVF